MTTITQAIPILTITAEQIGPMGITLSAAGDPGGHRTPANLVLIPILDLGHYDERQGCGLVHEYLDSHAYAPGVPWAEDPALPDYHACPSNRAGKCGGNGWHDPCLFEEPADSQGWARARRWRLLPSGGICLIESYDKMRADEIAWPAAKLHADLVALAFDIETDAEGAVIGDRPIETTGDVLLDALTLAHHLAGGPMLAEEHCRAILASHFEAAAGLAPEIAIDVPAHMIYAALCRAALDGAQLTAPGLPYNVETRDSIDLVMIEATTAQPAGELVINNAGDIAYWDDDEESETD